jgi:hypothetical protein
MKKRFLIAFLLISILLFNSCFFLEPTGDNSREAAEAHIKKVADALQNHDKDALKAMFSKKALAEAKDIDGKMDYLFNFFEGKVLSLEFDGCLGSGKNDYGHKIKDMKAGEYVYTDKQKYMIFIWEYVLDTDHPDNVGIYMLQVIKAEDEDKESARINNTFYAGIYMPLAPGLHTRYGNQALNGDGFVLFTSAFPQI